MEDYKDEGVPVIRVSNVRAGEVSEDKLVKISKEKHKQLRRSKVLPNDVLLTKAGAILGYSAVFPEHLKEGNITSHLVTITCSPEILPHYLKYIFHSSIGQKQIYRWGNKSTRPELNTQEVKKIIIPVLPLEQQKKIINIYHKAINEKKKKENETLNLLKSIDEYLLKELGITLPKKPLNNIKNRMFKTGWQKVSGNRFDPKRYSKQSENLIAGIQNSPQRKVFLKSLVIHSVAGDWGLDINETVNANFLINA
ncbi:MAG: restriction endonuclease subunit S [Bacteroidota bacterium]